MRELPIKFRLYRVLVVAVMLVQPGVGPLRAESPAVEVGAVEVATTKALVSAVKKGRAGDTINVGPGLFRLSAPLMLKQGMTLRGAGIEKTTITHTDDWKPSPSTLPDPEMKTKGLDTGAYLVRLEDRASEITISDLTLLGPQMHGAVFGIGNEGLHLHDLRVQDFLWAGVRTFSMKNARILDCEFIDAGGRWQRGGIPGVKGGITGGAIFAIWMKDSEIGHNRFVRTQMEKQNEFYGIKCRQGKRSRIHHNTIAVNFSIEMPFENDEDVEIDHNICDGTISIPKHAGGPVPESGRTFHIHHNYMRNSYSIEFVRNGVEIDHNLFDFDVEKDHGNLISGFGRAPAKGPALIHHNLISNPGRGVLWINEPYSDVVIRNNHVLARTTVTPRKEGLFGFHGDCDFSKIRVVDNVIECRGLPRPLFRNEESYRSTVTGNKLINVSDADRFTDQDAESQAGLTSHLEFDCGVHGEWTVDGWNVTKSK